MCKQYLLFVLFVIPFFLFAQKKKKDLYDIQHISGIIIDANIDDWENKLYNLKSDVWSYAVASDARGQHIGEKLVLDCLRMGRKLGFRVLQFNAVVESNIHARHLYERLGFIQLGTIPGGFRMKDGRYENICPYYHEL